MAAEAFVFDAYGTLYDVHSVAARCESYWPGKGASVSQLWRAKQLEYTWQRSLMRRYEPFSSVTRAALSYACAALRLELEGAQVDALMEEYTRLALYPEARAALSRLKGKKAILSNGSPDMLLPLVENSALPFDAVMSVDEVKIFKPAPEVYELAVRRLRTESIAFISANCWDALGAKSYGFTVYWINRARAPIDRLGFEPDAVLTSLDEVLQ
ncbi:MAG TPA: haloacid dehalogenase type II [Burkholderiales bacterium]|nr:haloacid dehalogenase type II [Burkholderiales bacterium]